MAYPVLRPLHRTGHRAADLLLSPGMIGALALLLLNDFVLKPLFANWLTGKLSDLAGLFAFPLFWSALAPRWRLPIYTGTALGFIAWKSAASQPLIDAWNSASPLTIGRTVDLTDLIALPMVVVSFLSGARREHGGRGRWAPARAAAVSVTAIFAFSATSYRTSFAYDEVYHFAVPAKRVLTAINSLDLRRYPPDVGGPSALDLEVPSNVCGRGIDVGATLADGAGGARLALRRLVHHCPRDRGDSTRMLYIVERCLVARLDSVIASTSDGTLARPAPSRPPLDRLRLDPPPSCTDRTD